MSRINPLFAIDGYKLSHMAQFPENTEFVYGNFTPRANKYVKAPYFISREGGAPLMWAGMQTFLIEWFGHQFNEFFFKRPADECVGYFHKSVNAYLGTDYDVSMFYKLHAKGHLPVRIRSIPEGDAVDIKTPVFTVINTDPEFYWLPNFLETLFSAELWPVATSASTAMNYRLQSEFWAVMTCDDNSHVGFQCHDFAARGNMGIVANSLTGIGHLFNFAGTDSLYARERFIQDYTQGEYFGWSVPATEHSVMCMGLKSGEFNTIKRLLVDVYPIGILAIVMDTWNFWEGITKHLVQLKDVILSREGKLMIRPDSGIPEDIICGRDYKDLSAMTHLGEVQTYLMKHPGMVGLYRGEYYEFLHASEEMVVVPDYVVKGAIQLLWEIFGGTINSKGFRVLDSHIGLIYGDSITLERQQVIFERLAAKDFASSNVVLGIGSFTYQLVTRDSFGFAMKATWGKVNGEAREIFKDPITDDGTKKSAKGLIRHYKDDAGNWLFQDSVDEEAEASTELPIVYEDGVISTEPGNVIAERVNKTIAKFLNWRLSNLGLVK